MIRKILSNLGICPIVELKEYDVRYKKGKDPEENSTNENTEVYLRNGRDWLADYIPKQCAEAFKRRKDVTIGETFQMEGFASTHLGRVKRSDIRVERLGKNVILYDDPFSMKYLVSSCKKELIGHCPNLDAFLEWRGIGGRVYPVLYRG